MWHVLTLTAVALLGTAQPVPESIDGHIPPLTSAQASSFACERVSASIRVTQQQARLLDDRSNLATAIRTRLDALTVDGDPLPARDFAAVAQRVNEMMRVESIQAICLDDEIRVRIHAVLLTDWLAFLTGAGSIPEPTSVSIRLARGRLAGFD